MDRRKAPSRELAIEAVVHRLALLREPQMQVIDIQSECEIQTWKGGYCCLMDGRPLAIVTLHSETRFTVDIAE